ncbi:HEPN domain-containing protein [Psychrosphaera aestuarii]|uniref:HEPN domain-containing protein n=1 Tax=Psychrosphaera aestuarii TaxID=1266052 RepID=UPI001B323335|nr:HEPN domain-containing protein [Psychrosphaera aestuarii]
MSQLETQWTEVDVLISSASECENSNPDLFNAVCRSTSVLIVAHMEGFIKDLTKNLIRDLNSSLDFKDLPRAIQNTCCQGYLGFNATAIPRYQESLEDMIQHLSECSGYKVPHEPFIFDKNRNPKPDSIQEVFKRLGSKDVFKSLHNSLFDEAFESDNRLQRLLVIAKYFVERSVHTFPYKASMQQCNLKYEKYSGRTLWQEFLDEINKIRHAIAHGNTFSNDENIDALRRRRNKAKLLQLVLIYIACCLISK